MRRTIALRAEIATGEYDAPSEDLLPQAIHGDSRSQRIRGRDQPLCQTQSRRLRSLGHGWKHGQSARLHFRSALAPIALDVNVRFRWRVVFQQGGSVTDRRQLCEQLV